MYQPKDDRIEKIAESIKKHLANNPDVKALTLFHLHESVNKRVERHEWEQALHRLNLQGIVGQAIHGSSDCCGKCRADIWMVTK